MSCSRGYGQVRKVVEDALRGLHCFVFGDQLASHVNENVTKSAMESGVFLWVLPSNCSHFLQVLDSFIFATLKNALRRK